ncbi:MAG: LacI family DNA-binding transcriptional regulator [Dermatophilaceae bacterium]
MAGDGPVRRPTLREIADVAGVAVSTASRTLTRSRQGLPPTSAAAERVLAAARQANYQPDLHAASLRTNRTHMLGVLVPHLTDVVLSTIYEGIDLAATELGYQTVVANTMDSPEEQRRRAELLLSHRVDGLIFGDAHGDDPLLAELAERRVPFILVSRTHGNFDSVTCDDYTGGRLAGTHLADLGHRRVGIIAGQPYASTGRERSRGCVEALAERGIPTPRDLLVHSTFDAEGGRGAALRLMRKAAPPTAIFAVNDTTAIGAMGALRDLGCTVGTDVAVVGFNDITIARDLPVPLSTVRSPLAQMGSEAAQMLISRLRGEASDSPRHLRLPTQLVVRESSDPTVRTHSSAARTPRRIQIS